MELTGNITRHLINTLQEECHMIIPKNAKKQDKKQQLFMKKKLKAFVKEGI